MRIQALTITLCCLTAWVAASTAAETPEAATPATEPAAPALVADDQLPYVYTKWKHFTVEDGLPNDHIFAVKADGDRVWVGTDDGLALIDKRTGKVVRVWKEEDGLPWQVVTGIEVDPVTGDVWLGLFGKGLARLSGGRFDHFHQLNSGLVNDVVYAITMENDNVWAATTAGSSRYNTKTKEWTIFTEKNAPMEEIWNYNVAYDQATDKIFLAVWGSGVLEFDCKRDREHSGEPWKVYLDPDGEMEIDLHRDDGIVHVITTGVSPVADVFWVSTYFGCCRYDGRHWRGIYAHETGLPSDFTNNVAPAAPTNAGSLTTKAWASPPTFRRIPTSPTRAIPTRSAVRQRSSAPESCCARSIWSVPCRKTSSSTSTTTATTPGWPPAKAWAGPSATVTMRA